MCHLYVELISNWMLPLSTEMFQLKRFDFICINLNSKWPTAAILGGIRFFKMEHTHWTTPYQSLEALKYREAINHFTVASRMGNVRLEHIAIH